MRDLFVTMSLFVLLIFIMGAISFFSGVLPLPADNDCFRYDSVHFSNSTDTVYKIGDICLGRTDQGKQFPNRCWKKWEYKRENPGCFFS